MALILALLGAVFLVIAVVGFVRRPEHTAVKVNQFEFKGPAAVAIIGCGLICAAVVKSNTAGASSPTDPIAKEDGPRSPSNGPGFVERHRSTRSTIAVPFYGILEIGGSCQGEHLLTDTWNCDASRTKRVHCQNDMVTVEPCAVACIQESNGSNDECR